MKRSLIHLVVCLFVCGLTPSIRASDSLDSAATDYLLNEALSVLSRQLTDQTSEKSLEQIVLTLANRPETPRARELIEQLSVRVPTVFIAHDEGGAMIPYVDVGAAARVTLRIWEKNTAYDKAVRLITAGDPKFLTDFFTASPPQKTGMINAAHNADSKDLVLYRDELVYRRNEPGGDQLVAVMAEKLSDRTLYKLVIEDGSAAVALKTIRQLQDNINGDSALSLMRSGLGRADIASATIFEIGKLTDTLPSADLLLWKLLDDPGLGGSAAAVLARHADNTTVNRLIELLQQNKSELLQQRIVLALVLSGEPTARQFADDWLNKRTSQDSEQ